MAQATPPSKGRPKLSVDRDQLEYLKSLHFTWEDISCMMGVSIKTLQRRAKEWNIFTFTAITDVELDEVIQKCLHRFSQAGEAMLRGHLLSLSMHVQRERLRMSVQRVSGSENQLHPPITRRTYSVPGPNALWHVDGNHKMIRWRLVVHGGIDGFSRLITFIQCSNNNRSETVLESFIKATEEYGVPSRLRTDHGGENVRIWEFMEQVRGYDRGSYIAGSSVHNTRIERLWRDVYAAVSSTYISVFTELEEQNVLDPDNDADLFCLHYIFIQKINTSLHRFQSAWNNHPLSTEGNRSPMQLYTSNSMGSILFTDNDPADLHMYGQDPEAPIPDSDDDATIVIPENQLLLSQSSLDALQAAINPLQECDDYGIQLYKDCVRVVHQLMQNDQLLD